jgi:hypothetical protein
MRARLLALPVALAAGALALAAPAGAVTIGIADQKPDMFGDVRFLDTGMRHARVAVGWDAMGSAWQVEELDRWMAAAREARVVPLVSFMHSRTDRRSLPTPERLLREFRRFRARYPWVREFATWNEVNHCGEPTCHRPQLVAAYWRSLSRDCRRCRVLAAEVLDTPNMVGWVRAFRRHARAEPRWWGLHSYLDANRFRTSATRRLLRATKGGIWLTEVGGIVERRTVRNIRFDESPRHAARAVRWVFQRLVPLSPRLQRVYVYHWNMTPARENWDSALIGPLGNPRPALAIVQREAARETSRRRARARARARTRARATAAGGGER